MRCYALMQSVRIPFLGMNNEDYFFGVFDRKDLAVNSFEEYRKLCAENGVDEPICCIMEMNMNEYQKIIFTKKRRRPLRW